MEKNNIIETYNNIRTPLELLDFMYNNITYGYITKDGNIYKYNDKNFNSLFNEYILQINDEILKTLVGTCWDQVEFERHWFLKNNYEIKTFFIMLKVNYQNNYPTHTYLAYKDKRTNNWCLFENADYNNRGIYEFKNLKELLKLQTNNQIKMYKEIGIKSEELNNIIIKEYKTITKNLNAKEFIEFVLK